MAVSSPDTFSLQTLWGRLTQELINIYDAHHVCVAAAQTISAVTHIKTAVILRSPSEAHYDVWLCGANTPTAQVRWWDDDDLLMDMLDDDDVAQLAPVQLADTPLSDWADTQLLVAPFYKTRHGMAPPGAICLADPPAESAMTLETLSALSHHITTYLERALLRYRATQQEIVFDVVNDITLSLTSTLSLEDIFDKVSNPIRRILNVHSVSIGLHDPASQEIVFIQELLGPLFKDLPTLRIKEDQGIAGWVLRHKEPLLVNDVYADKRFFNKADKVSGFTTHSILCVPLMVENEVIGILEAINKQIGRFDPSDLHLMQAIASPLAIAFENASLHSEVLAEKRRIETIFNNMSEGMLTTNAQGRITGANDSLLSLLLTDMDSIRGSSAAEMIKARRHDFGEFVGKILTAERELPNLACDVFTRYSSDAVPVLVSGANIRDDHGEVSEAIFVFSDLREIREVERMRDDFFHNIVHELRTPLATILMYARLLKKGINNPEQAARDKAARFLNTIERESDRLQTMVRQMLALAKLEAREIQRSASKVELAKLFDEIVPPLSDQARAKGLTFKSDVAAELPTIYGDREILYSIFKNLIENAIKFTPDGTVGVDVWVEDDVLYCEITDEGIGIPQEAMPNLFKRFYRTQTAVEHGIAGTGLGLYMCKEGIEKHKGTIDVLSEVGVGTQFIIRLPLTA